MNILNKMEIFYHETNSHQNMDIVFGITLTVKVVSKTCGQEVKQKIYRN